MEVGSLTPSHHYACRELMLRLQQILCPIDFSEDSARAYDYAQSFARHYGARLLLQHVVERPIVAPFYSFDFPALYYEVLSELRQRAAAHLGEFETSHIHDGFPSEYLTSDGAPADCILQLASERAVDLIVMGTHGARGFDRAGLGSVTEKVLRHAPCPVLAVHRPEHNFVDPHREADPIRLRHILVCTDFSGCADLALRCADSLAEEYRAKVTLLHVLETAPNRENLQAADQEMAAQLARLPHDPLAGPAAIQCRILAGKPYQRIVQLAREESADLIVMGVRGRGALDLLVFGSTTHRVLQWSPCPVLAVRYRPDGSPAWTAS